MLCFAFDSVSLCLNYKALVYHYELLFSPKNSHSKRNFYCCCLHGFFFVQSVPGEYYVTLCIVIVLSLSLSLFQKHMLWLIKPDELILRFNFHYFYIKHFRVDYNILSVMEEYIQQMLISFLIALLPIVLYVLIFAPRYIIKIKNK